MTTAKQGWHISRPLLTNNILHGPITSRPQRVASLIQGQERSCYMILLLDRGTPIFDTVAQ